MTTSAGLSADGIVVSAKSPRRWGRMRYPPYLHRETFGSFG